MIRFWRLTEKTNYGCSQHDADLVFFGQTCGLRGRFKTDLAVIKRSISGKSFCVSKSVSEGDNLFLILNEEVAADSILRLDFPNFVPAMTKDVTYSKAHARRMGQKTVKQLTVGSNLKNTGARLLFPAFDSKDTTVRFHVFYFKKIRPVCLYA